jgi:cell division protease FtsH
MLRFSAFRTVVFWMVMLLLIIVLATVFSDRNQATYQIPYSTFITELKDHKVVTMNVESDGQHVYGLLAGDQRYETVLPKYDTADIALAQQSGVQVTVAASSSNAWYSALLTTVLPLVLLVAAFIFIMQQTQGGGSRVMQFGRSRARLHSDDPKKRVTFDDVAGIDEVKEELAEIVDFLKHPKRYIALGARIPKGVLLYGEPGTGKTLVARAVAGEAGVPFFSISGSDFVEMFVGVGASRVRDLFEQAKKNAPCIVFIDEIDAVGRQRGAGYGGGHDEREQTLNQLLVEMDGFSPNEGIIIMAATNRPDVLDPALLRPGRFDRQIHIDRPDLRGREAILRVHTRGKPLEPSIDLNVLARRTPGFTGADIENMLNEGALLAARRRRKQVTMDDLEEAVDRIIGGGPQKKSRVISERERPVVAYHEAGHALLGKLLPNTDPPHKVTIIPQGPALGVTISLPTEDRYLITRQEILDRLVQALGGRAAEQLVFNEITSGASNDLEHATRMVRRMITEFGMSPELGPMTFGNRIDNPFLGRDLARDRSFSEEVAAQIDREISRIVNEAYERALSLLRTHRDKLDAIAQRLQEKETITAAELAEIVDGTPQTTPPPQEVDAPASAPPSVPTAAVPGRVALPPPAVRPRPDPAAPTPSPWSPPRHPLGGGSRGSDR